MNTARPALAVTGPSAPKEFGMMYELLFDARRRTFRATPNRLPRAFNIAWTTKLLSQAEVLIPRPWRE